MGAMRQRAAIRRGRGRSAAEGDVGHRQHPKLAGPPQYRRRWSANWCGPKSAHLVGGRLRYRISSVRRVWRLAGRWPWARTGRRGRRRRGPGRTWTRSGPAGPRYAGGPRPAGRQVVGRTTRRPTPPSPAARSAVALSAPRRPCSAGRRRLHHERAVRRERTPTARLGASRTLKGSSSPGRRGGEGAAHQEHRSICADRTAPAIVGGP